jgi:hypothetical protein
MSWEPPKVETGITVPLDWKNDGRRKSRHRNPNPVTLAMLQFLRQRKVGESFVIHNGESSRWKTLCKEAGRTTVSWRTGSFREHITRIWIVE